MCDDGWGLACVVGGWIVLCRGGVPGGTDGEECPSLVSSK